MCTVWNDQCRVNGTSITSDIYHSFVWATFKISTLGENLCQLYIWQGIELKKLTFQRINNLLNTWANEPSRQFLKEAQMAKKHRKKCPTSLTIQEMQIRTTLSFHLPPVRMAVINNTNNNKCWRGCGGKGTLLPCCWEYKSVQSLWEAIWRTLKELKIELWSSDSTPRQISERMSSRVW
jgi:hypothetical protein